MKLEMRAMMVLVLLGLIAQCVYGFDSDWDFNGTAYEEPAGSSCALLGSPDGDVYGLSFGDGTWIRDTPIFGDFGLSLFENRKEDAVFGGVSMTLRIMPHWKLAPFVGAGGSFNYALTSGNASGSSSSIPAETIAEKAASGSAESYWGGHVEGGARLWIDSGIRLIEVFGRYTWSSIGQDSNYWLIGISTGIAL